MNITSINTFENISLEEACRIAAEAMAKVNADGIYDVRETADRYYFIGKNPYIPVYGGYFFLYIVKDTGEVKWFNPRYEPDCEKSERVILPEKYRLEATVCENPYYSLISGYDYAYIYDKRTRQSLFIDNFDYYPFCGLIDRFDEFCVLFGSEKIVVYFIKTGEKKTIICHAGFVHGPSQKSESIVEYYCYQVKYSINVRTIIDGESLSEHDTARQVYREFLCPVCKKRFMAHVDYAYYHAGSLKEYAHAGCTSCNTGLYAKRNELEAIDDTEAKRLNIKPLYIMLR